MSFPSEAKLARGRPQRSLSATLEMRRRIVAAARELFAKHGYDGVSMRKIAALSGYGLTALYACFPAKRALLYVLWEDVFRELGEQLDRIAKATADPVERMRALAISTVWFWLDRPDDYRAIFLIEDRPEGPIDALFAITSESLRGLDVIRAAAAEAITAGRLSATDSQVVSRMLLTAVIGLAHALVCIPEYDWGDRDALVTGTFKALIEGLKSDKTG